MRALVAVGAGYGNIIMATPTIVALSKLGYEVDCIVNSRWVDAIELLKHEPVQDIYTDIFEAKRMKYDVVIHTAWGDTNRMGSAKVLCADKRKMAMMHETLANLRSLESLGWSIERDGVPSPFCGYREVDFNRDGYAVIASGFGSGREFDRKEYKSWSSVCNLLDMPLVVLGGKGENRDWMKQAGCIDVMCGSVSIGAAADVVRRASVVVGVDNGLMHIAAALGTPTIVLFGATTEIKNRPLGGGYVNVMVRRDLRCRPCQMSPRWRPCNSWRCMDFSPESVADVVKFARSST